MMLGPCSKSLMLWLHLQEPLKVLDHTSYHHFKDCLLLVFWLVTPAGTEAHVGPRPGFSCSGSYSRVTACACIRVCTCVCVYGMNVRGHCAWGGLLLLLCGSCVAISSHQSWWQVPSLLSHSPDSLGFQISHTLRGKCLQTQSSFFLLLIRLNEQNNIHILAWRDIFPKEKVVMILAG